MLGCLSFINLPLGGARVEQKTMTHEEVEKSLRHDTRSTLFNIWIFKSLRWIMMNLLHGCWYGRFCPSLQSCCMSSAGRCLKSGLKNNDPSSQCAGSVSTSRKEQNSPSKYCRTTNSPKTNSEELCDMINRRVIIVRCGTCFAVFTWTLFFVSKSHWVR